MPLKVEDMTPKEIRLAGLDALSKNLDVVGMIRFLQFTEKGEGNYTKDRHKWLGNPDFDEIVDEIEKMRR